MYLSSLLINPALSRAGRDLASCSAMHSRVLSFFAPPPLGPDADLPQPLVGAADSDPGSPSLRQRLDVLYRVDIDIVGEPVLVVQSLEAPNLAVLPSGYLRPGWNGEPGVTIKPLSPWLDSIAVGALLRFRLRANPTKKVPTVHRPSRASANPPREFLKTEAERRIWLERKAAENGFALMIDASGELMVQERHDGWQKGFSKNDSGQAQQVSHRGVVYDGVLRVEDKERFIGAVKVGIGPGKAYGFGLLTLAPTQPW